MGTKKKILVITPYWNDEQNQGRTRLERYVRWLSKANCKVTIISADIKDHIDTSGFGKEIFLKDFSRVFPERKVQPQKSNGQFIIKRRRKKIRHYLARLVLIPDYGIIWGWRVYFNKNVRNSVKNSDYILTSSPPESIHIIASKLAKKYNKKHVVDLRDGWLDDPLRNELKENALRRLREQRLEKKVFSNAYKIIVTSSVWKSKLVSRYRDHQHKIVVITNSYPKEYRSFSKQKENSNSKLTFLYLGRLSLSRETQKIDYLLDPLFEYSERFQKEMEINFVGRFSEDDYQGLERIKEKYTKNLCEVYFKNEIPKSEIQDKLAEADGLLLLCISKAAIPSKLFDYIPTTKPILAITPEESAVWNISRKVKQIFLQNSDDMSDANQVTQNFVKTAEQVNNQFDIPDEFSEEYLSNKFINSVIYND